MGKIRKCKLSWKPSESNCVVGYRMYWSNEGPVTYSSNYIKLGNITEINLPDMFLGIAPSGESIYLGISAVDKMGNESDMIILPEPYYLSVPPAPMDLVLSTLDDFKITEPKEKAENQDQDRPKPAAQQTDQMTRPDPPRPAAKSITTEGRIVDDFGYRVRKALED